MRGNMELPRTYARIDSTTDGISHGRFPSPGLYCAVRRKLRIKMRGDRSTFVVPSSPSIDSTRG